MNIDLNVEGTVIGPWLVIAGPTAVGKSEVALAIAERLGGEIVVADSRQVYRRIDVATAKPTKAERGRVPHHLIDVVDIGTPYSAGDFARDAARAIAAIQSRDQVAVATGGTGLYLAALAGGLDPLEDDTQARTDARERVRSIPVEDRHAALARVDCTSANRIHANDRQRVDRALEVYYLTGEPLSELQRAKREKRPHLAICLTRPRREIRQRIQSRFQKMVEEGLEEEARQLWEEGWSPVDPGVDTIGIQEWWPYFEGEVSHRRVGERIVTATARYAKRQMTWFRHQGAYAMVDAEEGVEYALHEWRSLNGNGR